MLVFYSEFKFEFGLNLKIEIRKIGEKKESLISLGQIPLARPTPLFPLSTRPNPTLARAKPWIPGADTRALSLGSSLAPAPPWFVGPRCQVGLPRRARATNRAQTAGSSGSRGRL
jgi:hypothetical protein